MASSRNYKLTVKRRREDGTMSQATYRLEHLHSTGGDKEQAELLLDLESQANAGFISGDVTPVRVWVEEDDERGLTNIAGPQ